MPAWSIDATYRQPAMVILRLRRLIALRYVGRAHLNVGTSLVIDHERDPLFG